MNNLLKTYNFSNFEIVKGNGCYLYTSDNKKLLDFSAGVAVNSLGYNHSVIKKTLQEQLKTGITHLSGSQIHSYKTKLSQLLSKESNKGDVFFSNSGAESIEAALKIARNFGSDKNRDEIIAMTSSFHGRTIGALSLGSNKQYKSNIGPVPGKVKFCQFNDSKNLIKLINKKTLAIIIEFIQGDGGINICSKEFAKTIKEICKKKKILLIADEIQGGIGRTGKIFAYKHYGVSPDIITTAKGLGSGIPIGATIVKKDIAKKINIGFHGSTFGGGMLQTRVAYNVFKIINKIRFLNDVKTKGILLEKLLNNLHSNCHVIKDIRIKGLMAGIEFKNNKTALEVYKDTSKKGLVTTLVKGNIIRITPPLVIKPEELKKGIKIISNSLSIIKS
ncbi:aminotransferase class III-fold pyridoxal phosphate-dependent enzyme [Alphaproteobacteria bacterium]|jgi:acetylornithine/succinyldiaminopimelate/putrescine aminotransferase|nr:aminotransferase class III-fold pyridoxal phosphate-dependent enzyme [Alphaproteobacteria bacterium]MDC0968120.1 aminotransferase class III-fold pyridoxal phosphate-dependent enzyme [Alphaproteobacteria bacterium]